MQDLWLYASGLGLLVSALLWPYLWIQFRSSGKTEPVEETFPSAKIEPLKSATSSAVSSAAQVKDSSATQPVPIISKTAPQQVVSAPPVKKINPDTTVPADATIPAMETKHIPSPEAGAVAVFLKDMKSQLDFVLRDMKNVKDQLMTFGQKQESEFDVLINQFSELKEREKIVDELKKQILTAMQKHDTQFETMLNQWNAMRTELQELKENTAAGRTPPAFRDIALEISHDIPSESAPEAEPESEPETAASSPAPAQESAGAAAPPENSSRPTLNFSRVASLNPEIPAEEESPEEEPPKPKRRGPVWPV